MDFVLEMLWDTLVVLFKSKINVTISALFLF